MDNEKRIGMMRRNGKINAVKAKIELDKKLECDLLSDDITNQKDGRKKFTKEQARQIKLHYSMYGDKSETMDRFGVSRPTLNRIIRGAY